MCVRDRLDVGAATKLKRLHKLGAEESEHLRHAGRPLCGCREELAHTVCMRFHTPCARTEWTAPQNGGRPKNTAAAPNARAWARAMCDEVAKMARDMRQQTHLEQVCATEDTSVVEHRNSIPRGFHNCAKLLNGDRAVGVRPL